MQSSLLKTTLLGAVALALAGCSTPAGVSSLTSRVWASLPTSPRTAATANSSNTDQGTVDAALQAVVQRANDEQQQAFSKQDATIMKDTATDIYYRQLVQTNSDLANAGVTSIKLTKLQFGQSSVDGSQAQLTTTETWQTTYSDGTTEEDTERNVYTLAQQNGGWKIQDDAHPDSGLDQTAPGSSGQPAPDGQPAPRTAPAGQSQSRNWSGYEASGGNYTSVSGTWTVPQINSGSAGADATWVGIGGVSSHDLIQAGTEATAGGTGRVRYDAWVETLPQVSHPVPLVVSPGDAVTVSISEQSPGQWLVNLKNDTSGQSYQVTEQYTSSHSSAEWIEEAPSTAGRGVRTVPLDNFGTVSISNATTVKDGQTASISQAGGQPITMINASRQPVASPSALSSDGKGFSVSRTANAAAPASGSTPGGFRIVPGGRGRGRAGFGGIPGLGF